MASSTAKSTRPVKCQQVVYMRVENGRTTRSARSRRTTVVPTPYYTKAQPTSVRRHTYSKARPSTHRTDDVEARSPQYQIWFQRRGGRTRWCPTFSKGRDGPSYVYGGLHALRTVVWFLLLSTSMMLCGYVNSKCLCREPPPRPIPPALLLLPLSLAHTMEYQTHSPASSSSTPIIS